MMSCAYRHSNVWYWLENGTLLGGYDTQEETVIERYCIQGSDKYQQLKEGNIKPRVGDFVKSKLDGFNCGHVVHLNVQPTKQHPDFMGIVYSNASGEEQFVAYADVVWIAPYEWSDVPRK